MATEAATIRRRRSSAASSWVDRHIRWLLVSPAILIIVALTIFPLGFSLWVSFVQYDFSLGEEHPWVGLGNFRVNWVDPVWRHSLYVTAVLATLNVVVELALGFLLALAMLRPFRGRRVLMSLFVLPLFMSPVVPFLSAPAPLLLPIILIAVTFRFIDAAKLFDIVYSLTRGGPGTDTYTTSYYLYQQGFQFFHLGQGPAGPRGAGGSLGGGRAARVAFIPGSPSFLLLPLYWVAIASFKPQEDLLRDPPVWWPEDLTSVHYTTGLTACNGWR